MKKTILSLFLAMTFAAGANAVEVTISPVVTVAEFIDLTITGPFVTSTEMSNAQKLEAKTLERDVLAYEVNGTVGARLSKLIEDVRKNTKDEGKYSDEDIIFDFVQPAIEDVLE